MYYSVNCLIATLQSEPWGAGVCGTINFEEGWGPWSLVLCSDSGIILEVVGGMMGGTIVAKISSHVFLNLNYEKN